MTKLEYTSKIEELSEYIVSDAMAQCDNDIEEAERAIFNYMIRETVDGHPWVIHCGAEILQNSDNHDAWEEAYFGEDRGGLIREHGVKRFDSIRAYYAMCEDVCERVSYVIG